MKEAAPCADARSALPRKRRAVAAAAVAKAVATGAVPGDVPDMLTAQPTVRGPAIMPGARGRTTRQRIGQQAEARARAHLEAAGLAFIAANVRYRVGELDLIMRDGQTVVFVEVRARASAAWGGAAASVDGRKQQRIMHAAQLWLQAHCGRYGLPACRFDVVAIEAGRLNWIRQAF